MDRSFQLALDAFLPQRAEGTQCLHAGFKFLISAELGWVFLYIARDQRIRIINDLYRFYRGDFL